MFTTPALLNVNLNVNVAAPLEYDWPGWLYTPRDETTTETVVGLFDSFAVAFVIVIIAVLRTRLFLSSFIGPR